MENKGKSVADSKEPKVEKLQAEELENRVAPLASPLDPSGDGLTGRIKPRDR